MKKTIQLIVLGLALGVCFVVGKQLQMRMQTQIEVQKILSYGGIDKFEALKVSKSQEVPEAKMVSSPEDNQSMEVHFQRVRVLSHMKKYETAKLADEFERDSFKRVFMSIAVDSKQSWLIQRQALRNLFLQKINLSDADREEIFKKTDRRALNYFKFADQDIVKGFAKQSQVTL